MAATSKSPTAVDDYFAALHGEASVVAGEFRQLILAAAPGITETFRYQMPCFGIDGDYLVHLGAWKKHIGLYPIPVFEGDLESELGAYRAAKDTVRFRYQDPVPWQLVERMIAEIVRRHGAD